MISYYGSLPTSSPQELSISSLNVLADDYIEKFGSEPYLKWEHRSRKLREHFREINSDVICLQEVQGRDYAVEFLDPLKELGYEGVMQETNHIVGVATFYRTSKFTLSFAESRSRALLVGLTLRQHPSAAEEGEGPSPSAPAPFTVQVANVHLEGHHLESEKRFLQVKSLLKRCQARFGKGVRPEDSPIIFCGDFNSGEGSGVAEVLKTGRLGPEFVENDKPTSPTPFTQPYLFKSAYEGRAQPTFFRSFLIGTIDHLFHTSHFAPVGLLHARQRELEEYRTTMLPNASHPSDHLPIGALLRIHPARQPEPTRKNKEKS